MAQAISQWQSRTLVLDEVIFGQLYLPIEDGEHVLGFERLLPALGAVALEAQIIDIALRAQQFLIVAAMGFVTGAAALIKRGLMVHGFLGEVTDVTVAAEADADGVGFWQRWIGAGVGVVAVGAIAGRSRVLHLGGVDQLCLVVMAGDTNLFCTRLRKDNLAVFGRGVAHVAAFVGEGWMHKLRHKLGRGGLVRVVAPEAIGGRERLTLVSLL